MWVNADHLYDLRVTYKCGPSALIPLSYIGTREICNSSQDVDSCVMQGPNGSGLPNTNYLLFVSAPLS